jgi:phage-related protein
MAWAEGNPRPLIWRANSKADFMAFPPGVQREMGYGLFLAQVGRRHPIAAKVLKGFGGASVLELKETSEGNSYRAVYTIRFGDVVYVLHAFQKKSKSGIRTPMHEMELIRTRLRDLIQERENR